MLLDLNCTAEDFQDWAIIHELIGEAMLSLVNCDDTLLRELSEAGYTTITEAIHAGDAALLPRAVMSSTVARGQAIKKLKTVHQIMLKHVEFLNELADAQNLKRPDIPIGEQHKSSQSKTQLIVNNIDPAKSN